MTAPAPLLEVRAICKRFPGVRALDHVSISVAAGETLAIVGENGAGKSTLMKILAGVYTPDDGTILLNGQPVVLPNVRAALARGIVLIHQELNLATNLSVAGNLFLGREPRRFGLLNERAMYAATRTALQRVGLRVEPDHPVSELTIGQQQLVEIARALTQSARIIIMDEPTSSLSQGETERLYQAIADLKRAGVTVLYISHRLAEVKAIADRVTVLRDGKNAGELSKIEINHTAIVKLMVGRDLKQLYARQHTPAADAPMRLTVRELRYRGGPACSASFQVHCGEIVGLAGLVGAGRTELAETLLGIRRVVHGDVMIDNQPFQPRSPRASIAHGLALAPEDRRLHGLVLDESVQDNVGLPNMKKISRLGLVAARRLSALARTAIERLRIKTPSVNQRVGLLSGGNQQKVVLGKWLAGSPRVLILDEPTRGVDVGARGEIYAIMDQLAGSGVAILMISSDLEEVIGMSDRVLVMHEGRLAGELPRGQFTEEAIMHLATGGGG